MEVCIKLCKSLSNQTVEWWKCHEVRMQMQNAKYKMQSTECKIAYAYCKCKILNAKSKIKMNDAYENAKSKMGKEAPLTHA